MALTVEIKNAEGKKVGSLDLPAEIFDAQTNIPLIHQVVTAQLAAARQGTQKSKNRGEVSGGGKKPFKQKGNWPCSSRFKPFSKPERWRYCSRGSSTPIRSANT